MLKGLLTMKNWIWKRDGDQVMDWGRREQLTRKDGGYSSSIMSHGNPIARG